MINNKSLKTDDRLIIRDEYGYRYYEIIEDNSHTSTSIYCYTRNRFLDKKEIKELIRKLFQSDVNCYQIYNRFCPEIKEINYA